LPKKPGIVRIQDQTILSLNLPKVWEINFPTVSRPLEARGTDRQPGRARTGTALSGVEADAAEKPESPTTKWWCAVHVDWAALKQ
jgi:hypothetical protein